MTPNGPELSIIIVNWNGMDFLPDCLKSIVENPPNIPYEIVVVDNDSSDGSADWLRSAEPLKLLNGTAFKLIESGSNLGFGPANNLAFDQTSSSYVFLLNPDTRVSPGAIDKLIETLESGDRIGIVGPKILNDDGTLQPSVEGHPATPLSIVIEGLHFVRFIPNRFLRYSLWAEYWDHNERKQVPTVLGAAMMCDRRMISESGGFDPAIHMYCEEMEWCIRIQREGWKVYLEPDAILFHSGGKSSGQRWSLSERTIVKETSRIYYEKKTFSPALNFSNNIARVVVYGTHSLRRRLLRKETTLLDKLVALYLTDCRRIVRTTFSRTIDRGH